jgi:DNA-binding IclR family transcriptional regulator
MKSIQRTFSCLQLFDEFERAAGMVEITQHLGYPASTVALILKSLVAEGYLHHDRSTRTYRPTVRLAQLGAWVGTRFAPDQALQEVAARVNKQTGEMVSIAARNDIRVQYLFILRGQQEALSVSAGSTRLLCRSGLGWALLSFLDRHALVSVLRRTNAMLPAEDRVDVNAMHDIADRCREVGYVFAEHTVRPGGGVIALPVFTSRMQFAIGVHGQAARLRKSEQEIVALMKKELAAASPAFI